MQCWIVVLRVLGVVVDEVPLDLRVVLDKIPLDLRVVLDKVPSDLQVVLDKVPSDLRVVLDKVLLDLDLWVLQDKVHHHFHLKVEELNMRHLLSSSPTPVTSTSDSRWL